MFCFEKRLPPGFVQSEESIVIDPVALCAVLADDLPYRTIRTVHFRSRCPSILCCNGRGNRGRQSNHEKQNSRTKCDFLHYRFHPTILHQRPVPSSQPREPSRTVTQIFPVDAVQVEDAQQHVRAPLHVVGKDDVTISLESSVDLADEL